MLFNLFKKKPYNKFKNKKPLGYKKAKSQYYEIVVVYGNECEFFDCRLDRKSVSKKKFFYEVAGDDEYKDKPARISKHVLINFCGTIISDEELPLDEDGYLFVDNTTFVVKEYIFHDF